MPRFLLAITVLLLPFAPGCGFLQASRQATVAEKIRPEGDDDGWMARTRRRFADAAMEIKADLNFHETEGLEQFAPDALSQVNSMRGEMNGSQGIDR